MKGVLRQLDAESSEEITVRENHLSLPLIRRLQSLRRSFAHNSTERISFCLWERVTSPNITWRRFWTYHAKFELIRERLCRRSLQEHLRFHLRNYNECTCPLFWLVDRPGDRSREENSGNSAMEVGWTCGCPGSEQRVAFSSVKLFFPFFFSRWGAFLRVLNKRAKPSTMCQCLLIDKTSKLIDTVA